MGRKPRIEYEGAVYHVINRGDRGGKVFKDRLDFELFLRCTADACERTGWRIRIAWQGTDGSANASGWVGLLT